MGHDCFLPKHENKKKWWTPLGRLFPCRQACPGKKKTNPATMFMHKAWLRRSACQCHGAHGKALTSGALPRAFVKRKPGKKKEKKWQNAPHA